MPCSSRTTRTGADEDGQLERSVPLVAVDDAGVEHGARRWRAPPARGRQRRVLRIRISRRRLRPASPHPPRRRPGSAASSRARARQAARAARSLPAAAPSPGVAGEEGGFTADREARAPDGNAEQDQDAEERDLGGEPPASTVWLVPAKAMAPSYEVPCPDDEPGDSVDQQQSATACRVGCRPVGGHGEQQPGARHHPGGHQPGRADDPVDPQRAGQADAGRQDQDQRCPVTEPSVLTVRAAASCVSGDAPATAPARASRSRPRSAPSRYTTTSTCA